MPTINSTTVMNQSGGAQGHQTCGYHTFKNTLLALLFMEALIDENEFNRLLNDSKLFETIFGKTVVYRNPPNQNDCDVDLPLFVKLLGDAQKGALDLTAHGISTAALQSLNLEQGANQKVSVVNCMLGLGTDTSEFGHSGMEDDLFNAAAIAKLARTTGTCEHVFAVGINNQHWVTASMTQDIQRSRVWKFMDSSPGITNKDAVVNKMEAVLTKTPKELKKYLLAAYNHSSSTFDGRYNHFLTDDGEIKDDALWYNMTTSKDENAKQHFVDNGSVRDEVIKWIENRFVFIQTADWFDNHDAEEQRHINRLYNLANFIQENSRDQVIKDKLIPICEIMFKYIPSVIKLDMAIDSLGDVAFTFTCPVSPEKIVQTDSVRAQVSAANDAIASGPPPKTEGFLNYLVNAIKYVLSVISDAVVSVFNTITGRA